MGMDASKTYSDTRAAPTNLLTLNLFLAGTDTSNTTVLPKKNGQTDSKTHNEFIKYILCKEVIFILYRFRFSLW